MNKIDFCEKIIGKKLYSSRKLSGCELYEMIFCDMPPKDDSDTKCKHTIMSLHVLCPIEKRNRQEGTSICFDGDTESECFDSIISSYVGQTVAEVELYATNDLRILIGDSDFVITTNDDCEESWRLFCLLPHLVSYRDRLCWE